MKEFNVVVRNYKDGYEINVLCGYKGLLVIRDIDNVGDVWYYLGNDVRSCLDDNCNYMLDKVNYDIRITL